MQFLAWLPATWPNYNQHLKNSVLRLLCEGRKRHARLLLACMHDQVGGKHSKCVAFIFSKLIY